MPPWTWLDWDLQWERGGVALLFLSEYHLLSAPHPDRKWSRSNTKMVLVIENHPVDCIVHTESHVGVEIPSVYWRFSHPRRNAQLRAQPINAGWLRRWNLRASGRKKTIQGDKGKSTRVALRKVLKRRGGCVMLTPFKNDLVGERREGNF